MDSFHKSYYVAYYREMFLQKKEITIETFRNEYYGTGDEGYTLSKLMNYYKVYMKEGAQLGNNDLGGIQKNGTFHLARHTFATTITLVMVCQLNQKNIVGEAKCDKAVIIPAK